MIHLWPLEEFEPPMATNFTHVCVVVEESIEEITDRLADASVEIDSELASLRGATGEVAAVYVTDPFGDRIELKERV